MQHSTVQCTQHKHNSMGWHFYMTFILTIWCVHFQELTFHHFNQIPRTLPNISPEVSPWEMGVAAAVVTGDLPLVWPDWLVVEGTVLVGGELVGGRWPTTFAKAAKRPSGLVPYCTGWNNLKRKYLWSYCVYWKEFKEPDFQHTPCHQVTQVRF